MALKRLFTLLSHPKVLEDGPFSAPGADQAPIKRRKLEVQPSSDIILDKRGDSSGDKVPDQPDRLGASPVTGHLQHIAVSQLTQPKSLFDGWEPPLPVTPERQAISHLMDELQKHNDNFIDQNNVHSTKSENPLDHVAFELSSFTIYKPESSMVKTGGWDKYTGDNEMVPLHALRARRGCDRLLVDGILSFKTQRRYIRALPFETMSIEGYGDHNCHSVAGKIWIQSTNGFYSNLWYRLGEPSPEYARYHNTFLWIADFGKHFIDYVLEYPNAELKDFRTVFQHWLLLNHGSDIDFQQWMNVFGRTDFRTAIAAHFDYLWKESNGIGEELSRCLIWKEIDPNVLGAVPLQRNTLTKLNKTVVTPFVYECFRKMYFSSVLEPRPVSDNNILKAQDSRKKALGFARALDLQPIPPPPAIDRLPKAIRRGDVVGVSRDTQSVWKDKADTWFAYVRKVCNDSCGKYLAVTWLYKPEDTTLSNMTYPYQNELFMSDHCNCGDNSFRLQDVTCKIAVDWSPTTIPQLEYFARQKYSSSQHSFVSIKPSDFVCDCGDPKPSALELVETRFKIRDTILAVQGSDQNTWLEPFVIADFIKDKSVVQVRQLLRARRDVAKKAASENELVWTDRLMEIPPESIQRRCHIRFFLAMNVNNNSIPSPYNRGGQADCFYITSRLVHSEGADTLHDLEMPFPSPMTAGFDPAKDIGRPLLNMLSLFSGGGNFDRGLEEGGAVQTKWAAEWDTDAVHTYKANLREPESTQIFLGSVDELIARAIDGQTSSIIPQIGEVHVISGGSPCQGFSIMQPNTLSLRSLVNASKVASVAAFIDHYRPAYALLENVVSMTRMCGVDKRENVFSQMLCTLVGMGYQVEQFNLDAWSFGAPQARSRLFVAIAAPEMVPLFHPNLTHSHPPGTGNRKLGAAINGEPFGERRFDPTPFKYISCSESTRDLETLGDGHVQTCISFPDHRTSIYVRPLMRHAIKMIPTVPREQSLVKTLRRGMLPGPIVEHLNGQAELRLSLKSNAWTRINPSKTFPTIVTNLAPSDAKAGFGLHWDQHRVLTVMEARRAQGFLDDEPIIGAARKQWKIIGNSVARPVSLALGISIRKAWLANPIDVVDKITNEDTVLHLNKEPVLQDIEKSSSEELGEDLLSALKFQLSKSLMSKVQDSVAIPLRPAVLPRRGPEVVVRAVPHLDRSEYEDWSDEPVELNCEIDKPSRTSTESVLRNDTAASTIDESSGEGDVEAIALPSGTIQIEESTGRPIGFGWRRDGQFRHIMLYERR